MKKILIICLITCLVSASGCKDYLDINKNPNAPENAAANLYLAPMLHWMVTSPQFDARFIGRYTQNWYLPTTAITTWDQQGYDPSSDNAGQLWRDVYWSLGHNLNRMIKQAEAEQRWDVLGVGYILKAWGWQSLTDLHGEIVIKEAFDETKTTFKYDTQEFAYQEVQRLLTLAIASLQRTDGFVNQSYLAVGDKIYNGDRNKWIKFAYGLLAINLNHYSNKTALYNPDAVIDAVNKSFTSNIDNALLAYSNTANDDTNFFGPRRQNMQNYRQSQFILNLLNGSQFGGVDDIRRTKMLVPSPDGQYRGLEVNTINFGSLTTAQRPNNIWGYPANISSGVKTTYLFDDKSVMPGMTYSQLQFIKAEASYKKGDKPTALAAYTNGVSAHIDFVNERNLDNKQLPTQITAIEKAAFLANPNIVPTAANLNLSQIMSQKYIAQWGWGHLETWMDLRRYSYTNTEASTGKQVFLGFSVPIALFGDNGGKTVQRIRPRYNSEYVWNIQSLEAIGGLATDYQTKPLWIIQP
jgi:hypothetical protein